jgi:hypothetical protein
VTNEQPQASQKARKAGAPALPSSEILSHSSWTISGGHVNTTEAPQSSRCI